MESWTAEQRVAFGARLKKARDRRPQAEVGAMFDLTKQAVSAWEKGRNTPTFLANLATAMQEAVAKLDPVSGEMPVPAEADTIHARAVRLVRVKSTGEPTVIFDLGGGLQLAIVLPPRTVLPSELQ